jgi:hypothetical protein
MELFTHAILPITALLATTVHAASCSPDFGSVDCLDRQEMYVARDVRLALEYLGDPNLEILWFPLSNKKKWN